MTGTESTDGRTQASTRHDGEGGRARLHDLLSPDGLADLGARSAGRERSRVGVPDLLRLGDWRVLATPSVVDGGGRPVAEFRSTSGRLLPILELNDGRLEPPFQLDEAYRNYLTEAWVAWSPLRRLSSRQLATFYRVRHLIPRGAQMSARRALIRWQGTPSFPRWPLDDGVERLMLLYAAILLAREQRQVLAFRWFWPAPFTAALVLTHDVETEKGIRLAVEVADLEESLGFRSAFNFGAWYDVDIGVLRDLVSRGFEVGMHGIVHDHSLFSSRAQFERQLPLLRDLAGRLGAVGFRSPSTHRVYDWIAELPVEYDGTMPHSDPYEPQPGGCCSLWPFFVGDVVELPYTLPQDHTLLTLLGHRDGQVWIDTAREIERRYGLIHCVSHPDRGYLGDERKRRIYEEFLVAMTERESVWHTLPADVATWWRARDAGDDARLTSGTLVKDGDSPTDVQLVPPAATG